MLRRILLIAGLAALLFGVLPGLAAAESSSPTPKLTFRIGVGWDVNSLNPFAMQSTTDIEIVRNVYDTLTWWDQNYQVAPDLATKWSVSDDGLVWTFTTRTGVKWHDGVPFTAHDVAFTYNLIMKSKNYFYIDYFQGVKSVEAPDDTTVVITCTKPSTQMLNLWVPILPEHLWKDIPLDKLSTLADPPLVGTGQLMIDQVKKGSYVSLKPNKDYFEGATTVDEVILEIYQNLDSLAQDYKVGHLDAAIFESSAYLRPISNMTGSTKVVADRLGFHELSINCWTDKASKGNPLLRDKRIRQAMNWAIDKEKINQQAMLGTAKVGTSILCPLQAFWHWEPPADQLVTYDPERAKQILDAAGYTDRNGDGVRESSDGKKLEFRLTAMTQYPPDIIAAKLIAGYLKDVGIATKIEVVDEGSFIDRLYGGADYDMAVWSFDGDPDPYFMLSAFTTGQVGGWSTCNYSNATYDQLFVQQGETLDRAERKKIIDRMQEILYEDAPYIVLWYQNQAQAYRTDRWTGWELLPTKTGRPFFNQMHGTFANLNPVVATQQQEGGGLSGGAVVGIVVACLVVVGGAGLLVVLRRRRARRPEED